MGIITNLTDKNNSLKSDSVNYYYKADELNLFAEKSKEEN